jgi:hypothetical protein
MLLPALKYRRLDYCNSFSAKCRPRYKENLSAAMALVSLDRRLRVTKRRSAGFVEGDCAAQAALQSFTASSCPRLDRGICRSSQ